MPEEGTSWNGHTGGPHSDPQGLRHDCVALRVVRPPNGLGLVSLKPRPQSRLRERLPVCKDEEMKCTLATMTYIVAGILEPVPA